MKRCYICENFKEDNEFVISKNKCKYCYKIYRKNYYEINKIKIAKRTKKYYELNKSTVLEYQKEYYYSNTGKINSIFNAAKRRAIKKSIEFDLSKEWIILKLEEQKYCCALTKIQFIIDPSKNYINPYMPSLDRIDSSKGYTKENVRIVCSAINLALNEFGEETFKEICHSYIANL